MTQSYGQPTLGAELGQTLFLNPVFCFPAAFVESPEANPVIKLSLTLFTILLTSNVPLCSMISRLEGTHPVSR